MATSKVIFSYPSGETLVVRALPLNGSAYLLQSTSVSEAPANSGLYTGTFTEIAALSGAYRIVITLSGTGVASYQARWTGSDGETVAATELIDVSQLATAANLTAVDTVVDSILVDTGALSSALSTVDGICDSILIDTGTTIPAQISGLNNFNPASDTVANVTLCATTTTNTDMVAAPDNSSISAILTDTGTTLPAQISALNNVAATDIVSAGAITTASGAVVNVDLVDVCSVSSDMRGTDSAATAANLATVDSVVDAVLVDTGTTIPAQISALNDIAATDIVSAGAITTLAGAIANVDLVDVCSVNSDMVGTDSAATAANLATVDAVVDAIKVVTDNLPNSGALSDLATAANLATVDTVVDSIKVKSDQFVFSTANQVDAKIVSGGGGGGDATAANQTAILAKLNTNPIEITNPLVTANTLVLINKDNYSATNSRLLTFPVVVNYASATSVKLIFSTSGTNVKVTGAVVASATSITVDVEIDFGSSLTFASCNGSVCDQVATCDFSLVAKYGTDQETITYGTAYIYDRAVEAV